MPHSINDVTSIMDASMRAAMRSNTDGNVMFVPGLMDVSCGSMPVEDRHSAMSLMISDLRLMMGNMIRCTPEMMRSMFRMNTGKSMMSSMDRMDIMEMGLQVCLGLMQMGMMMGTIPVAMMLPGMLSVPLCMLAMLICTTMCWPMNGEMVMKCGCCKTRVSEEMMADERWFHVNGSMTSSRSMMSHLNRLSSTFGRPITGVHNRTYGPIMDMIMPMMMPMIKMNTSAVMMLQQQLRDAMLSPSCKKVVVIAHGTGAAILSETLDRLHRDMSMDMMRKIEIYTFGAAARSMSSPMMMMDRSCPAKKDGSDMHRVEENERLIPHMEHYAMTTDLMASCGIMHYLLNILDNRFCGRAFVVSRPGFMFSHYMDMLFPHSHHHHHRNPQQMSLNMHSILESVVDVDVSLAEKREFTAMGMNTNMNGMKRMSLKRNGSGIGDGLMDGIGAMGKDMTSSKESKKEAKANGERKKMQVVSQMDGVAMARLAAKQCEGMSVKELSRLWMYCGGRSPMGEGRMNGSGMDRMMNGTGMTNGTHGTAKV